MSVLEKCDGVIRYYKCVIPNCDIQMEKNRIYLSIQVDYARDGFKKGIISIPQLMVDTRINHIHIKELIYNNLISNWICKNLSSDVLKGIISDFNIQTIFDQGNDTIFEIEVSYKPEIKLPEYLNGLEQKEINVIVPNMGIVKNMLFKNTIENFKNNSKNYVKLQYGDQINNQCILLLSESNKNSEIVVNLNNTISDKDSDIEKTIKDIFSKDTFNRKVGDSISVFGSNEKYKIEEQYTIKYIEELSDKDMKLLNMYNCYNQNYVSTFQELKTYVSTILEKENDLVEYSQKVQQNRQIFNYILQDCNLEISEEYMQQLLENHPYSINIIDDLKIGQFLDKCGYKFIDHYKDNTWLDINTLYENYSKELRLYLSQINVTIYTLTDVEFKSLILEKLFSNTQENQKNVKDLIEEILPNIFINKIIDNMIKLENIIINVEILEDKEE